jgi:glycosyltransferase involved in cell wall biosynthesis
VFGRLAEWGHSVTLLCSGWEGCAPRTELDGIEVHRVGRRYTFSLHARRYFRERWGRGRPFDVIVEDLNKVPLFTPRWSDTPVVLLVHHLFGATAFQEANPLLAAATWLLERPVPRVFRGVSTIAVSRSTAEDLVRRGLRPDDITVIPNGIDVEHYTPLAADAHRFERPTILFMGRVKKYKRVDLILRALASLPEGLSETRLVVAGKGEHLEELRARAAKLGLEGRVEFLGFVEEARKLELLRRSWVHVLTSPKEGWGIANLEAAACGTPSVASDSPGLRESVLDGETGLLTPHGDVDALRHKLETLLTHGDMREEMGRRARTFAKGFSWSASAAEVLAVLEHRVAAEIHPA